MSVPTIVMPHFAAALPQRATKRAGPGAASGGTVQRTVTLPPRTGALVSPLCSAPSLYLTESEHVPDAFFTPMVTEYGFPWYARFAPANETAGPAAAAALTSKTTPTATRANPLLRSLTS